MSKLGNCQQQNQQNQQNGDDFCCVDDQVCLTVELGDLVEDDPFVFWENRSGFRINGTIVVKNNELDDDEGTTVELIINGVDDESIIIEPGDTKSVTADNLMSLALEFESFTGNRENTADVSFSLHYKF